VFPRRIHESSVWKAAIMQPDACCTAMFLDGDRETGRSRIKLLTPPVSPSDDVDTSNTAPVNASTVKGEPVTISSIGALFQDVVRESESFDVVGFELASIVCSVRVIFHDFRGNRVRNVTIQSTRYVATVPYSISSFSHRQRWLFRKKLFSYYRIFKRAPRRLTICEWFSDRPASEGMNKSINLSTLWP
jgi:hypothetical protein